MSSIIIKNGLVINRGKSKIQDVLIKNDRIHQIADNISSSATVEINAEGKWIIPGIIDDQVHFREPGLTHKANIQSESRAAVAGGVTSFMEMPNTKPAATTQELLQKKYDIAANTSYANYSFFMGAANDNFEEVMKTDPSKVCGIKIFMGSSTGNMLVDNQQTLDRLFSNVDMLIATHCEDEMTVRKNLEIYKEKYGDEIPFDMHPIIRSREACLISSSTAINLAKKHGTRLHILHISTEDEINLFSNDIKLEDKKITSELCVHHLYFNSDQYATLGSKIKCNPAIKDRSQQEALLNGLKGGFFDVIATDHAPHTQEEKSKAYTSAPSGLPLIQHSLNVMLDFYNRGEFTKEFIVQMMCHNPSRLFRIIDRGYIDEGYYADLVIVDPEKEWTVATENIYYKCGWSPLEGKTFKGAVESTIINGQVVYSDNEFKNIQAGSRLAFNPY